MPDPNPPVPGTPLSTTYPATTPVIPAELTGTSLSNPSLKYKDCTNEEYCEYAYYDAQNVKRFYYIAAPVRIYYHAKCTTHHVLDDAGVVHVVPAINQCGCVRRYKPKAGLPPAIG